MRCKCCQHREKLCYFVQFYFKLKPQRRRKILNQAWKNERTVTGWSVCSAAEFSFTRDPTKKRQKKERAANSFFVDSYQQHLAVKRENRAPADGGLNSQGPDGLVWNNYMELLTCGATSYRDSHWGRVHCHPGSRRRADLRRLRLNTLNESTRNMYSDKAL